MSQCWTIQELIKLNAETGFKYCCICVYCHLVVWCLNWSSADKIVQYKILHFSHKRPTTLISTYFNNVRQNTYSCERAKLIKNEDKIKCSVDTECLICQINTANAETERYTTGTTALNGIEMKDHETLIYKHVHPLGWGSFTFQSWCSLNCTH